MQSKGHLLFDGNYEIYTIHGNIYKAQQANVIDVTTGYRLGADFQANPHTAPYYLALLTDDPLVMQRWLMLAKEANQ